MIPKVLIGNLFDSQAEVIVNTVNTVGVMGKGIALEFKRKFPDNFEDYAARCARGEVRLGEPYLYKSERGRWIINFPTKEHWRSVTNLDDITRGLEFLRGHYQQWGVRSLAVPPLGCGNGQLEWAVVGPTLFRHLAEFEIPVELYAPYGTAHEQLRPQFLDKRHLASEAYLSTVSPQWIRPAWVALADVVARISAAPMHWPVGRIRFQKIAYVATRLGLPTGLAYEKRDFGPFAKDVSMVIGRMLQNNLLAEHRSGRMLIVTPGKTLPDARQSFEVDLARWNSVLERIVDLFSRSTTEEAERAASIMFAADDLAPTLGRKPTEREILDYIMGWKRGRTPELGQAKVSQAIRTLAGMGWIEAEPSPGLLPPEPGPVTA